MAFSDIWQVLKGETGHGVPGTIIRHLCTDSRLVNFPSESLFIALVTTRRNGHRFIADVYQKGGRFFLVSESYNAHEFPDAFFLKVTDTLGALQKLSATYRQRFQIPVIGITGSNGKTIVKEWLYQMLWTDKQVCRSPRSYNSQIGVPLSVWQLAPQHELAIFEAGISTTGEMDALQRIIRPSIGIFTNLGAAHDDGFIDRKEKLDEKWKLFVDCNTIICHTDDETIHEKCRNTKGITMISWGQRDDATYRLAGRKDNDGKTMIQLIREGTMLQLQLPFTDDASVENALHCAITCLHFGMDLSVLNHRLQGLHALPMRLEWKKGWHQSLLLNDSYSHDINSLEIALDQLAQQAGPSKRIAILSGLPGVEDEHTYLRMAALLSRNKISMLAGVGAEI
ncbi:MAG TPA: Mur ligase family protein, partial [Phnomibacter sp.]|nr:Mur ligase family protein [Phnomibacter sp.]